MARCTSPTTGSDCTKTSNRESCLARSTRGAGRTCLSRMPPGWPVSGSREQPTRHAPVRSRSTARTGTTREHRCGRTSSGRSVPTHWSPATVTAHWCSTARACSSPTSTCPRFGSRGRPARPCSVASSDANSRLLPHPTLPSRHSRRCVPSPPPIPPPECGPTAPAQVCASSSPESTCRPARTSRGRCSNSSDQTPCTSRSRPTTRATGRG